VAEWIAVKKQIVRSPEVIKIAKGLNLPREQIVCLLIEWWGWLDDQTEDGFLPGFELNDADTIAGHSGFGRWLAEVGWLIPTADGVQAPRYELYHPKSAKRRMLAARRKKRQREAKPE
jgi:hypothetical protein